MGMVASLASKKEIKPRGPVTWVKLYFSFPISLFLKLKITHSILSCDWAAFVRHWFPGCQLITGTLQGKPMSRPRTFGPSGLGTSCRGQSVPCSERGWEPHPQSPLCWSAVTSAGQSGSCGQDPSTGWAWVRGSSLAPVSPKNPQSHDWGPSLFSRD